MRHGRLIAYLFLHWQTISRNTPFPRGRGTSDIHCVHSARERPHCCLEDEFMPIEAKPIAQLVRLHAELLQLENQIRTVRESIQNAIAQPSEASHSAPL